MEIGNERYELEMEDKEYGIRDGDIDGWNWSWDDNVGCGFNNIRVWF